VELTEQRLLREAVEISTSTRIVLATGQSAPVAVNLEKASNPIVEDMKNCVTLSLETPLEREVHKIDFCTP